MQAYVQRVQVGEGGAIVLPQLHVVPGTTVEVIVLLPEDAMGDDLMHAAESSLSFWDNPIDDSTWNHV